MYGEDLEKKLTQRSQQRHQEDHDMFHPQVPEEEVK
jgi:hypothetical protein